MAKLILPDGSETPVTPANHRKFTLEELQTLVGGPIEILDRWVTQPQSNGIKRRVRLVMHEEGKLEGLAVNPRATQLSGLWPDDVIVGPVVWLERGDSI